MPESSVIRFISVLVVMLIAALIGYGFTLLRLGRKGVDPQEARSVAKRQARWFALIGVFLYLLSMVSIASLFVER